MSDFIADSAGLHHAVDLLVAARASAGSPHHDGILELGEWPATGMGGRGALEVLAGPALHDVTRLEHPGFFAHMDPPTPWVTWATSMWAAAGNQNLLHPDSGPTARQLERQVVDWLAPAFGMDGGHMVPGSTVANLTALWAAREVAGVRRVICSTANHLSIAKAAHLLGLELLEVPVDAAQRLRLDLLPEDLSDAALVLVAGTVATGAVDPLSGVDAAWRHVDAAWAGPLRLSSHAHVLSGVEVADSVSFSAHKWLFQPKESAMVLFADTERAHAALAFGGSYLSAANVGLLGSHGSAPALNLAATLLAWGQDGVRAHVDAGMSSAQALAAAIIEEDLTLWRPPVSGVVNWRVPGVEVAEVRDRIHGAWISQADIAGEPWLRSVAANPLADPQVVVDAVRAAVSW